MARINCWRCGPNLDLASAKRDSIAVGKAAPSPRPSASFFFGDVGLRKPASNGPKHNIHSTMKLINATLVVLLTLRNAWCIQRARFGARIKALSYYFWKEAVMRTTSVILKLSLACLLLCLPAAAQTSTTGVVQGTVTDPQGAVVSTAEVKLLDPTTNRSQVERTSNDGLYAFVNVPPGIYTVTVAKTGFRTNRVE